MKEGKKSGRRKEERKEEWKKGRRVEEGKKRVKRENIERRRENGVKQRDGV